MIESSRLRDQLFLAAAVGLLLLVSMIDGTVAVAIAAGLLGAGLIFYPGMRRTIILTALLAAGVAFLIVLVRPLF